MNGQNKHSVKRSSSSYLTATHRSLVSPTYPSYLRQTLYENLALTQYNLHLHKQHLKPIPITLQPLSDTSNLEEEQLIELDLRLPTAWNPKDKSSNIEVGSNGLDLSYTGPGLEEADAALVRSNFPMRSQTGIFYFEMKVISKGAHGFIGIGFCYGENNLERLPGWNTNSWGYHGDDGHSFAGSGTGKDYGPRFTTGDTIGCGVNFSDRSAFYTKNGWHLGTAFKDLIFKKPIYPAIGLRTQREKVTTNFGNEPFVFDIEKYVRKQRLHLIEDIVHNPNNKLTIVPTSQDEDTYSKEVTNNLILSYLIHHGYTGTAKAVVQNAGYDSTQDFFLFNNNDISKISEKDMEERQLIRSSILKGKIEDAIKLIDKYFPGVLQEEGRGQDLHLWLKCTKFIEMIREYCEYMNSKKAKPKTENGNHTRTNGETKSSVPETCCTNTSNRKIAPIRRRRSSYSTIAVSLPTTNGIELRKTNDNSEMMDIDSAPTNSLCGNVWERRPSISNPANRLQSNDNGRTSNGDSRDIHNESTEFLKRIMLYGQKLKEEYRDDIQEKTRSSITEISSLLAYQDPDHSPVAYLMDISRRDALATEVNATILAFLNRPEMPAMERVYRQVMLCNKELACEGDSKAALINVEGYYSNKMSL
ncbi:hypothetical protein BD770DRAFT_359510 [Pilaira anomala]|nr:hypothetical protein BD770DRAFT_359510 [Pilaira anomala]